MEPLEAWQEACACLLRWVLVDTSRTGVDEILHPGVVHPPACQTCLRPTPHSACRPGFLSSQSLANVTWEIPAAVRPGLYRLRHYGEYKHFLGRWVMGSGLPGP